MLSVRFKKQRGDFNLDVAFSAPTPGLIALFGRSGCGKDGCEVPGGPGSR